MPVRRARDTRRGQEVSLSTHVGLQDARRAWLFSPLSGARVILRPLASRNTLRCKQLRKSAPRRHRAPSGSLCDRLDGVSALPTPLSLRHAAVYETAAAIAQFSAASTVTDDVSSVFGATLAARDAATPPRLASPQTFRFARLSLGGGGFTISIPPRCGPKRRAPGNSALGSRRPQVLWGGLSDHRSFRRPHPPRWHGTRPPPRDLVDSAMLKSAGTATGQTGLHQKPGEIGRGAPRESVAAPGTLPV